MGQDAPAARTGKKERDFFAWLVKEMREHQVFHVKMEGVEVQMSQYAFAPKAAAAPAFVAPAAPRPQRPAEAPEFAAIQAFKPWKSKPQSDAAPAEQWAPLDPTDPDAEIDDDALFGANIPSGH